MGLTKEQLHKKREDDIAKYVEEHGSKLSETVTYWGTYPICVMDICVLGVAVKGKKTKKILFGDYDGKKFKERKSSEVVEHTVLAEVLDDMKAADGKATRKEEKEAKAAKKTTVKKPASPKKAAKKTTKKTVKK